VPRKRLKPPYRHRDTPLEAAPHARFQLRGTLFTASLGCPVNTKDDTGRGLSAKLIACPTAVQLF